MRAVSIKPLDFESFKKLEESAPIHTEFLFKSACLLAKASSIARLISGFANRCACKSASFIKTHYLINKGASKR